jgi:hypothetical protein
MVVPILLSSVISFVVCIKRQGASKGEIQRQEWAAEG